MRSLIPWYSLNGERRGDLTYNLYTLYVKTANLICIYIPKFTYPLTVNNMMPNKEITFINLVGWLVWVNRGKIEGLLLIGTFLSQENVLNILAQNPFPCSPKSKTFIISLFRGILRKCIGRMFIKLWRICEENKDMAWSAKILLFLNLKQLKMDGKATKSMKKLINSDGNSPGGRDAARIFSVVCESYFLLLQTMCVFLSVFILSDVL